MQNGRWRKEGGEGGGERKVGVQRKNRGLPLEAVVMQI